MNKRGGEYQDFPSSLFCLSAKKFRREESFSVSLISGIEKVWIRGGDNIKSFSRKLIVSNCRKFS